MSKTNESEHIVGGSIFLRPPTYEDASEGPWYSWFNDPEATRFNSHGVITNTREAQIEFYKATIGDESRRVWAICDRSDGTMIGVNSLQQIDLLNRKAEIAIMIGDSRFRPGIAGLEAFGLLTQYGFQNLAIDKIWAGSHEGLRSWVELLAVIGFKIEAEVENEFWDDDKPSSVLWHACYRDRFEELAKINGAFDAKEWSRYYFRQRR